MQPPINHTNDVRYWLFSPEDPLLKGQRVIRGRLPRAIGCPQSRATDGIKGLHMRLDLVCEDDPCYNPSITRIPPSHELSQFAKYVGFHGIGGFTIAQLERPGDPKGGVDFRGGTLHFGKRSPRTLWNTRCEIMLLDENLNVVAQVCWSSDGSVYGSALSYLNSRFVLPHNQALVGDPKEHREDCRALFYRGELYVENVVGYWERPDKFVPTNRVDKLDLRVLSTGSMRYMRVQAAWPARNDSAAIDTGRVVSAGPEAREGVLGGKNHVLYPGAEALYVVNRFYPLEIWAMRGNDRAELMPIEPQPEFLGMEEWHLNAGTMLMLHETDEWLGLVHTHRSERGNASCGNAHYTHAFFTVSAKPPHRVTALSDEFCISSLTRPGSCDVVQFLASPERDLDTIIVPYGRGDIESAILTLPLEEVRAMLQPIRPGKNLYRRLVSVKKDVLAFPSTR
jgi:hypothetical protein